MVTKSTCEKFYKQIIDFILFYFFIFIQNILYFVSKSVKCKLWQISNEIVDNQDL